MDEAEWKRLMRLPPEQWPEYKPPKEVSDRLKAAGWVRLPAYGMWINESRTTLYHEPKHPSDMYHHVWFVTDADSESLLYSDFQIEVDLGLCKWGERREYSE